jgi:1-acyl-sn-glycerol-3-phosphate acyltransferase
MGNFFVHIYNFFERRRALLWSLLAVSVGVLAFFALKVRYNEQITNIFPDNEEGRRQAAIFDRLKIMDKVIVMFSSSDPEESIACADEFEARLMASRGADYILSITSDTGEGQMDGTIDFIYDNLPVYLTDRDYLRLDSLLTDENIAGSIEGTRLRLASPMGMALRDVVLRDPLGIATDKFAALQNFSSITNYEIYSGHIFSPDLSTMLMVIEPLYGISDTKANDVLISAIERCARETAEAGFDKVQTEYFGGPSVAVHNARRIKADTALSLGIALAITILFIFAAFRNRWAVLLITTPVIFGALFALGMIWLTGHHTISAIAVGAGAAVLGIALSYSIHVISHANHTSDPRQIIRDLAWPLTIGSFTTIGAFVGLLFTSSQLLRDFGLFAALTLVGTTLFCLIFLPHMLRSGRPQGTPNGVQRFVERISGYAYDRNRILVWAVVAITVVCLFFYGRVRFDSDMMNLNYMPQQLKQAEEKLKGFSPAGENSVLMVSTGVDFESAYGSYLATNKLLSELHGEGKVAGYVSAADFLLPPSVQAERMEIWNDYWDNGRLERVIESVEKSAAINGFRTDAFGKFAATLRKNHTPVDFTGENAPALFRDRINVTEEGSVMLISHVKIPSESKEEVYARFSSLPEVVIVDRSYYASKMVRSVNDDFYLVLFISSILIFVALLISYGRIELTLMAFMPMFISWIIILGLMAMMGIEFNIVSIILSTFIFGIGDDFSIFIMDGLLAEYRDGKKMLTAHKTAILFSAFTVIVGLGVLVLAKHPAMHSLALVSVLGILTVIAVSYILQPVVFSLFVTSQTQRGGFPYTLAGLANTIYCFSYFLLLCLLLQTVIVAILPFIPGAGRRKLWIHRAVRFANWLFLRTMITTKRIAVNEYGETFEKPAVIIANHQSFIDILVMLSLHPKVVMVTNSWVWRSPFFGRIVRYADFYHTADGYDKMVDSLREKVADGYSVIVFPEGTRSEDQKIKRFHKGAFYLAQELGLDIVPIVLYGTGLASSKRQPFYIKKSLLVSKILPRIAGADASFGTGYKERAKQIGDYFRREYDRVYEEYNRARNPYFFDALIKNYTYKGPVLEWYMRVKVRMERNYDLFDRIVPREGEVVDIGCGYGPLSLMLAMLSDKRRVLGIDYDCDKIAVAEHCFSRDERVRFVAADALTYDLPVADAFILSDVLHYLDFEGQDALLTRCFERVNNGGVVIVRDGDSSEKKRHRATKRSEEWSTRIVGFNKTVGELHFTDSERIRAAADRAGFGVEIVDNGGDTSNKIYIMKRV